MEEQWKDIDGYEGLYRVSNTGRVFSIRSNKIMKPYVAGGGYLKVLFKVKQKQKCFSVHRLVACAFLDNPRDLPDVNHKDEDKANNSVDNLEWCTHYYNMHYGTCISRNRAAQKCKPVEYFDLKTGETLGVFPSLNYAGKAMNISFGNISRVCNGTKKSLKGYGWRYA